MITRIQRALAVRRGEFSDGDKGFTLIELLVVVIIIGILAAIAIPIYVGVQISAKDSAVKSDLINAKIAIVAYYGSNNAYPPAISTANLGSFGYSVPASGPIVVDNSSATATINAFCLKETSGSSAATVYYITQAIAPTSTKPASGCN